MITKPIFFARNRVGRVYTGGKLFASFFGDEPKDGHRPEEWVASAVRALNREPSGPHEGLSRPEGFDGYFDALLLRHPRELLGTDSPDMGFLVKILDSAVRLPVQAHPDKAFSRRYFNSQYGKAESWVILDVRPGACVYLGFREGVSRAHFEAAIEKSEQDKNAMAALLRPVAVRPGDVFFIPAKMVHAIGAGCLLLEVQEPTDFTVQPERFCADYRLSDYEMYLGIAKEDALQCFDYTPGGRAANVPRLVSQSQGARLEALITAADTDCFSVSRLTLSGGEMALARGAAVVVITHGAGLLKGADYARPVKKGDYFFLPHCAAGRFALAGDDLCAVLAARGG